MPLAAGLAVPLIVLRAAGKPRQPLAVVPSVDLGRYMGKWYEIARLPNRFQRDCASDTSATYALRGDGRITVVNQCRTAAGGMKSASGTAKLAGAKTRNSILKVTFFWPFYGDYWIIDLAPDYCWALVGEPRRKYLWVLSRDPHMDEATLNQILETSRRQGYDTAPLLRTRQRT